MTSKQNDDRIILSLDFIGECGDLLVTAGTVIAAAASAERIDVLELVLPQARSILIESISEFKALASDTDRRR